VDGVPVSPVVRELTPMSASAAAPTPRRLAFMSPQVVALYLLRVALFIVYGPVLAPGFIWGRLR
jgi:hypothetical protein